MAKRVAKKKTTTAKPKKSTTRKPKKSTASTKKRVVTKKPAPKKQVPSSSVTTTRKKPLRKNTEVRFIRISENSKNIRFKEMGDRIQNGEIEWSYYAIDGNVGYHYYKVLK